MLTEMTEASIQWGVSNPGPATLLIWLEPWAEEFAVPVRSTVNLRSSGWSEEHGLGGVELTREHIVIWACAPTIEVFIDGSLQESGSSSIPIPDGLTKEMLGILFADQPTARLAGAGGLRDQPASLATLIARVSTFVAVILSFVLASATAYSLLLFWAPHNYAPFWMRAIPWIVIAAAPLALAAALRKSKAVFLISGVQVALTFYPLVIPVSLAWTSTDPWRFVP